MIVLASKATITMLTLVIAVGILLVAIAAASLAARPRRTLYYDDLPYNRKREKKEEKKEEKERA